MLAGSVHERHACGQRGTQGVSLVVPDARVIGQHADAIIFNVAWNRTSRAQVKEALRQLETVGLTPSGLVLSQIDVAAMKRYGHGGKHGAYGTYGNAYYDA